MKLFSNVDYFYPVGPYCNTLLIFIYSQLLILQTNINLIEMNIKYCNLYLSNEFIHKYYVEILNSLINGLGIVLLYRNINVIFIYKIIR